MKSSVARLGERCARGVGFLGAWAALMLASHWAIAYDIGGPEDNGYVISDENRAKIAAALPENAPVPPKTTRKLLVFDVNVVYGGHPSRFYANLAFQQMGETTGAFDVVITRDPAVFEKDSLAEFDAVFFNNTVGNQFDDPVLRENLLEFVYGGGGLMGVHGTTMSFWRWGPDGGDDWPEFGRMLGGRGAAHREAEEHAHMKVDSPGHPLMAPFPQDSFELCDEFFRVGDPYSRNRVRVLFSIDTEKTDLSARPHERQDQDYAVAWVRHYGRGRVFYSTVGHNPYQFWDPVMLEFYLGAAQFVLGDLDAPTVPSARLTPAIEAREELGWRLGLTPDASHRSTLFETIDKAAQLGLAYVGGGDFQKVSSDIGKDFNSELSDEELKAIRLKLDDAGVRMMTYACSDVPGNEAEWRALFAFANRIGVEVLLAEPPLEALDGIERQSGEYDISLALPVERLKASPNDWTPETITSVFEGRGPHIGVCASGGIEPSAAASAIGPRLLAVRINGVQDTDTPQLAAFLEELHRQGIQPRMFLLEDSGEQLDSMPALEQSARSFDKVSLELAR